MVSSCETCLRHQTKQPKEPVTITDFPVEPWQKVGTDPFHLDGKNYLLVIDYFSNYLEMVLLPSMSATCVITHIKSIFARHGIPQIVYNDNGPCYSCKDFQSFTEEYDFQHVTSSNCSRKQKTVIQIHILPCKAIELHLLNMACLLLSF